MSGIQGRSHGVRGLNRVKSAISAGSAYAAPCAWFLSGLRCPPTEAFSFPLRRGIQSDRYSAVRKSRT
jgi:hypothetical protein